jgi:hypothetical protein
VVNTLYIWDSKIGATGGYENFNGGTGFECNVCSGSWLAPGGIPETNSQIQSGQAFFVAGTGVSGTVQLTEASKVSGSSIKGLRPTAPVSKLSTRLYVGNQAYDGNTVLFDNKFSNEFDQNDAPKLANPGENFAIATGGKDFAVDARTAFSDAQEILFSMNNMKQQTYTLEFTASNLKANTAYLVDNYLGTSTTVDLTQKVKLNFNVNGDAKSAAANRFKLVFRPSAQTAGKAGIRVTPNPVEGSVMNVEFKAQDKGRYELRLMDVVGRVVYSGYAMHAGGSSTQRINLTSRVTGGAYQLVIVAPNKTRQVEKLVVNLTK